MLSGYLNQTAVLTRAERDTDGNAVMNNRGEVNYLAPVSVPCRRELSQREILTPDAQTIKTNWVHYLVTPVATDDVLDGLRVQLVEVWAGLGGATVGYKAVV